MKVETSPFETLRVVHSRKGSPDCKVQEESQSLSDKVTDNDYDCDHDGDAGGHDFDWNW